MESFASKNMDATNGTDNGTSRDMRTSSKEDTFELEILPGHSQPNQINAPAAAALPNAALATKANEESSLSQSLSHDRKTEEVNPFDDPVPVNNAHDNEPTIRKQARTLDVAPQATPLPQTIEKASSRRPRKLYMQIAVLAGLVIAFAAGAPLGWASVTGSICTFPIFVILFVLRLCGDALFGCTTS